MAPVVAVRIWCVAILYRPGDEATVVFDDFAAAQARVTLERNNGYKVHFWEMSGAGGVVG